MLSLQPTPTSPSLTQPTILLAIPDPSMREALLPVLTAKGYQVKLAATGRKLVELIYQPTTWTDTSMAVDLLVLDTALPQLNSLDFCRRLRTQGSPLPILLVSHQSQEDDKILGLESGADDYLVHPVGLRELVARCAALLRRSKAHYQERRVLQFRDIKLDPQACRVLKADRPVALAPKEYRLLEVFLRSPHKVWSRQELLSLVWGHNFFGDPKTLDVHISHLRSKLERDPANPEYIVTVRGWGYRLG